MSPELRQQAQRAVQVVTRDGRRLSATRAVLFVLDELRWHPALVRLARQYPFLWVVELGYRFVARNRGLLARLLLRDRA